MRRNPLSFANEKIQSLALKNTLYIYIDIIVALNHSFCTLYTVLRRVMAQLEMDIDILGPAVACVVRS